MRLTLRNLLAYMDEQLEPADAQEVARMIEASPFATELMHRLRDVSRRLKLGAPKVDSRGLAGDANSVAEYLDHTMSPEQVAEFEKLCLASEVHLAEVTSAHQILALVLGERAEIDPQMRRRMYALPQREEAATEELEPAPAADDAEVYGESHQEVSAPKSRRRRPEIPEWLRDQPKPKNHWLFLGVAAVLLIGAGIGVAWYYARLESSGPVVAQMGAPTEPTVSAEQPQPEAAPAQPAADAVADESPAERGVAEVEQPAPLENAQDNTAVPPVRDVAEDNTANPDAGLEPASAAAAPSPIGASNVAPENAAAATVKPIDLNDPFNDSVPAAPPSDKLRALEDPALIRGGGVAPVPGAEPAETTADVVGRLINDNEVLLRVGGDRAWRRLSLRDALLAGDELLAAPTYRPGISLRTGDGATAHLLGGSLIRMLPPDENSVPGLNVVDGQVVVSTAGKPGTPLNVQIGNEQYRLTFVTGDAMVAVDVRHSLPDGADPLTTAAKTTVDMYVPSGEIEYVAAAGGETLTAKAPAFVRLMARTTADESAFSTENTFPAWINGNPLSQVEKWAADIVDKELNRDEPVEQRLRELAEDRKVEVRDLAVHCLTLIGDFRGLLPLLSDTTQRSNWSGQIEAVRRVLARDPQMADRVQKTLENQCDQKKAKEVYEMLLGFSMRQLQDGAAARLVADLDDDDLDVRVLAFWNLQRVAVGTQGYKPENDAVKRRASVKAWRDKLDKGQIVPKGAP